MKINWISIKGFRNFVDETIHFSEKSLIIGANDVRKSNLLYALRLIFDKSISYRDLELTDRVVKNANESDFLSINDLQNFRVDVCWKTTS